MKKLVVATRNKGKLKEISALLTGLVDQVVSIAEFPDVPETVEDQDSFAGNALKKAREASIATGLPVLADDSGLVVDALDGAPGVFSARFAGEGAGDAANNAKLLEVLEGVDDLHRNAAFVCTMAFVTPEGVERIFEGRVAGRIISTPRGDEGFGYDPIFLVSGYDQTMAELPLAEKNRISHRGQALQGFCKFMSGAE
jgi:XTP/dITP diphosphohydrolase